MTETSFIEMLSNNNFDIAHLDDVSHEPVVGVVDLLELDWVAALVRVGL